MKYKCPWPGCGEEFEKNPGRTTGWGKHKNVSDQIKCPRCGNFLPTWNGS